MKISSKIVVLSIVVILFCGIFISDSLGLWKTESSKIPATINEGEFAGEYNPEDIRGSYSFRDIENAFGVRPEVIARAFNLESENPGDIKAKDLETVYDYFQGDMEIGTGSIKLFVSLYTGLPYLEMEYLPSTAVEVLKEEGKWSDELEALTRDYIIDIEDEPSDMETSIETEDNEDSIIDTDQDDIMEVKGMTTFADIMSWGIEKEKIEEVLGFEIENENMLVRDECEANGLSFSEVKSSLNDLLE
jgi:hypothetical protein